MHRPSLCLLTALFLAGCGGGGDKAKEGDRASPGPTSTPPSPTISLGRTDLPKDFPADVPVYPGGKVLFSATVGDVKSVQLMVSEAGDKVVDFYETKLKGGGWNIFAINRLPDGGQIAARKGEHSCSVVVGGVGGSTTINLGLSIDKGAKDDPPDTDKTSDKDKKAAVGKDPMVTGVPLPKDMPRDVPLIPGAKVTSALTAMGTLSVSFTTSQKMEKVFAYVAAQMKENGWKELTRSQEELSFTIAGEKDGRFLTITGNQDESETVVAIVVFKKS